MHRVLILGGELDLQRRVEQFLTEAGHVSGVFALSHMPGEIEISRILQTQQPDIAMVVVTSMMSFSDFMLQMESLRPNLPVVALSQYTDQRTVRELILAGIKGFIPIPLVRSQFVEVFKQVITDLRAIDASGPTPHLFSFLPGKGGSGTSRLACHFSLHLAAEAERTKNGRVLLLDLDLACGLSRYLFQRSTAYSLIEMVESGVPLDATYWNQFTARHGSLDVIFGGRSNPRHPLSPAKIKQVVDTACGMYQAICVDLTGNSETFSLDILSRSARIFLVTSTDPGALQLSRERFRFLERIGLGRRAGVLLNRLPGHSSVNTARVGVEIGAPVIAEFDFDERRALEAMGANRLFDERASLSRHIQRVSQKLVWEPAFNAFLTRLQTLRKQTISQNSS